MTGGEAGNNVVNTLEQVIIIFTKATFERLLREKEFEKIWALYSFYVYTAKWQRTNHPRATISYCAKGMRWDRKKVMRYRKILKEMGLIEDVIRKNKSGKVKKNGHYVKVRYILNEHSTNDILVEMRKKFHSPQNRDSGKNSKFFHSTDFTPGGEMGSVVFSPPNALDSNKMLCTNSKNASSPVKKNFKKRNQKQQHLGEAMAETLNLIKPKIANG